MGYYDYGEVKAMLVSRLGACCFDCEGSAVDNVPECLSNDGDYGMIRIDGQWFSVNWPNAARGGKIRADYYQAVTEELYRRLEAAAAGTPLSSSSKSAAALGGENA